MKTPQSHKNILFPMNPDARQLLQIAEARDAIKTEVYVIVDQLMASHLPMYSDVLKLSQDQRRELFGLMLRAIAKRIELVDCK